MGFIRTKPIEGPKAWRGRDLKDDPSWTIRLEPEDIAEIDAALAGIEGSNLPLPQLTRAHFPLERLAAKLARVLAEVHSGRGFCVLRGLPVEKYTDGQVALIYWGMGRYLGKPIYQNPKGDLIGHVRDSGRAYGRMEVRGYETRAHLPFHSDGSDVVGLLCLRKAKSGGLSSIVSSTSIHNEVLENHPEYLGLLYSGYYYIRREMALSEKGVSDRPIPVFGQAGNVVSCRYIRDQINAGAERRGVPFTRAEQAALDYIDELTRRPDLHLDMDLEPGDIQFLNNYTVLHSRTEFEDGVETSEKRHLLRLWLKFFDEQRWPIADDFARFKGYAADGSLAKIED